jgi:hypothetical protein
MTFLHRRTRPEYCRGVGASRHRRRAAGARRNGVAEAPSILGCTRRCRGWIPRPVAAICEPFSSAGTVLLHFARRCHCAHRESGGGFDVAARRHVVPRHSRRRLLRFIKFCIAINQPVFYAFGWHRRGAVVRFHVHRCRFCCSPHTVLAGICRANGKCLDGCAKIELALSWLSDMVRLKVNRKFTFVGPLVCT